LAVIALMSTARSISFAAATIRASGAEGIAFSLGWPLLAIALAFRFKLTVLNLTGSDGSIGILLGTTRGGCEMPKADRQSPKPTLRTRWALMRWYVHAFFYRLIRRWL
jgi:hypothetical protein